MDVAAALAYDKIAKAASKIPLPKKAQLAMKLLGKFK